MTTENSINYVYIIINQRDTQSDPNPKPNPTTKRYSVVSII